MHGFGKREMNNPWEEIKLDDYEKHMSLDSVKQLQTMNKMMKEQFDAYQVNTAMIFGIAGGNGLEHVSKERYVHNAKAVKNRPLSVCGSGLSLVVR